MADEPVTESKSFCPSCGGRYADGDKCPGCGTALKSLKESLAPSFDGGIVEAIGSTANGSIWKIAAIRSGVSKNGREWPAELLESQDFLGKLNGAAVYEDHDPMRERTDYPVRRVANKIGNVRNPRAVRTSDGVMVEADLYVVRADWRQNLLNAQELGLLESYAQFSINALGDEKAVERDGRRVRRVTSVERIRSLDAVTEASAGGGILQLVADARELEPEVTTMTEEQMAALRDSLADVVDERIKTALAAEKASATPEPPTPVTPEPVVVAPVAQAPEPVAPEPVADPGIQEAVTAGLAEMRQYMVDQRNQAVIATALAEAKLPEVARGRVKTMLEALATRRELTPDDAKGVILEEQTVLAAYANMANQGVSTGPRITGMTSPAVDYQKRLINMFSGVGNVTHEVDEEGRTYTAFRSLREAYCAWDRQASAFGHEVVDQMVDSLSTRNYKSAASHKRITESITTADWGDIVQDSMYVMLLRQYRGLPYDEWRKLVSVIEPRADFRARHWTRTGGYGDLPIVNEGGAYQPLTSPTDEEINYTIAKRGGLEEAITLEMIANDEVGALASIPLALARSAKRTLYKFVFALLTGNPTMDYDSTALYDATHSNTGTAALSLSSLSAVDIAMQGLAPRLHSSDVLGVENAVKYIIGARNLRPLANRIINPTDQYAYGLTPAASTPGASIDTDTNLDPHQYKGSGVEFITNEFATDTTDWYTMCDPRLRTTIVMGFYGGNEEPELFIQADPNSGTMYGNDVQSLKVRHIYGGDYVDHTTTYREVVSGG